VGYCDLRALIRFRSLSSCTITAPACLELSLPVHALRTPRLFSSSAGQEGKYLVLGVVLLVRPTLLSRTFLSTTTIIIARRHNNNNNNRVLFLDGASDTRDTGVPYSTRRVVPRQRFIIKRVCCRYRCCECRRSEILRHRTISVKITWSRLVRLRVRYRDIGCYA
jgi:hypothetical protein